LVQTVVKLGIRSHPEVLFAYTHNWVEIILRVENPGTRPLWMEADIALPEKLSLNPEGDLRKGRLRVGILGKREYLEKAVKVFAGTYTNPQMYACKITLFSFDKDGVIGSRIDKGFNLRCEAKKEASI